MSTKTFWIPFNGTDNDDNSRSKGYLIPVSSYIQFHLENDKLKEDDFVVTTNYSPDGSDPFSFRKLSSFGEKVCLAKVGHYEFRVCSERGEGATKTFFMKVTSDTYPGILGLTVQTLIPKLMGDYHDWERHFATAARTGYNAIHLTPIHVTHIKYI